MIFYCFLDSDILIKVTDFRNRLDFFFNEKVQFEPKCGQESLCKQLIKCTNNIYTISFVQPRTHLEIFLMGMLGLLVKLSNKPLNIFNILW